MLSVDWGYLKKDRLRRIQTSLEKVQLKVRANLEMLGKPQAILQNAGNKKPELWAYSGTQAHGRLWASAGTLRLRLTLVSLSRGLQKSHHQAKAVRSQDWVLGQQVGQAPLEVSTPPTPATTETARDSSQKSPQRPLPKQHHAHSTGKTLQKVLYHAAYSEWWVQSWEAIN